MIKMGGKIGALNTIALVFFTAIIGIYYARIQGVQTLKSGLTNLYHNKAPIYELISGASIALAAILLIIPGFATDIFGFLLIFPLSRKFIFSKFKNKINKNDNSKKDFIEGDFEDIEDDNDKKL